MLIHFARLSLLASLLVFPLVSACGDGGSVDADPFDTYQACFDDHHGTEGFTAAKAITICCLDHPIGSNAAGVVCGATEASCDTYVTANVVSPDVAAAEITAACTDYVTQKGM
ncbi:MAG: hypothetical protein ABI591_21880 [Kofleriaceae bacterium]